MRRSIDRHPLIWVLSLWKAFTADLLSLLRPSCCFFSISAPVLTCTLMVQVICISFQQQAQKDSSPAAPGCQFQERKLHSADWCLYHFMQVTKIPVPQHSLWWQKSPQWTCPRPEHFCQWFPGPGSSAAPAHSHGWKRMMDPALVTVTRNCPPNKKKDDLGFHHSDTSKMFIWHNTNL